MENLRIDELHEQNIKKGKFDSHSITKYFNNQAPFDLNGNEKYTDPEFPPNENSLLSVDKNGICSKPENQQSVKKFLHKVDFKRADDIFGSDWEIFQGKIECDDIKQGELGNCYFMSAVSTLIAKDPMLIYQLFRTNKKNQISNKFNNYFEVVLFIEGEWQVVIIDDYFVSYKEDEQYFKNTSFPFSRPNQKELWVLILEKAWAKVQGGYSNSVAGTPTTVFQALTGHDTESIFFKCPYDFYSQEKLWEKLVSTYNQGYVMCTVPSTEKYHDDAIKFGLIFTHSYSLVLVKEGQFNGENLKMVKIRNPWGNGEWTGKYSDNDTENWTEEKKAYFGFEEAKDDGSFYMQFEDYFKYWGYLLICQLKSGLHVRIFEIPEKINLPIVFNLYLEEDSLVELNIQSLTLKKVVGSVLFANYNEKKEVSNIDGSYIISRDVTFSYNFKKGLNVVWVYEYFYAPESPKISIRFSVNKEFKIKNLGYDENFSLVRELIGSGYLQDSQERIQSMKKNNAFHSWSYRYWGNTGIGYHISFGYPDKPDENYLVKLKCDREDYAFKFLPPHKNLLECEYIFNTRQKKPVVVLGLMHENEDWRFFSQGTEETDLDPTEFDFYEYEKYLTFEFVKENAFYDYLL